MGKAITKKIRGMGWTAKISLVLICTMLISVFMYQGLFKPRGIMADVVQQQGWSTVYAGVALPGSYAYPISAGPNRKLVVAVSSTTSSAAAQTVSVSYGGQALTQGAGDTSSTTTIQHTYLFYLDEAGIAAASGNSLSVSIATGGTAVFNTVYAAVYNGAAVSVSTPVTYNNNNSSAPTFNPTLLSIAAGELAVEAINLASVAGTAPTISTYASGWSQALGNTTAFGNASTPGAGSYAAVNAPAVGNSTTTYSAHTASGNASVSMSAMIINKAAGAAVITSVATPNVGDPTSIYKADTVSYPTVVTINGTGLTGTTAVGFLPADANIVVAPDLTVVDDTKVTVTMTASAAATVGNRTLSVTNAAGTSYFVAANFVKSNLPAPTITLFSPATIGLGNSSKPVTITGTGFQPGATIAFGPNTTGLTFSNVSVDSATSLSLLLSLSTSASVGQYTATITNPDSKNTGAVNAFIATPAPAALVASPYGLAQDGNPVSVTLSGTGFANGVTVTALGNSSCTIGSPVVFNSMNSITVPVTANTDAAAIGKFCTFIMINPDGGNSTNSSIVQILALSPTTPVITSVLPNAVAQNVQTGGPGAQFVDVIINGSGFDATSTVAFSSSRVALVSTTYVNPNQLVARITTNTSGAQTSTVTVTSTLGSFTGTGAFYITAPPTLTSISQASGALGSTYPGVIFTGTGFQAGAQVALLTGSGVNVSNVNVVDSTKITADIEVTAGASLGLQTVAITNPDLGRTTSIDNFNVQTLNPPTTITVAPNPLGQGATNIDVVIFGTNFTATPTVKFGTGGLNFITNSVLFNSSTQLTANLTIATGVTAGTYNVIVTNPNNEAAIGSGLLTVTARPGTATVLPTSAPLGTTNLPITITTSGLAVGPGFGIVGDTGVTVGSPAYVSATSATATVSVDPLFTNAPLGNHTITLTNGDYGTRTVNFTVTGNAPTITSITPTAARLGATAAPVVITGDNFYPGATFALGNSTGITIASQNWVNQTTINATLALTSTATAGPADITVRNSDGQSATATGLLSTLPAPTFTSNSPLTGGQGANVDVTITGTGFDTGAVALFSGTGITVNGTDYVSDTQVTAHITIAADALQTERSITVTNTDGSNAAGGSFTVTLPVPTTIGDLSFYQVGTDSITVVASYANDGNNDNSCVIKWGTAFGSYTNTATAVKDPVAKTFTASLSGLPAGSDGAGKQFFFEATFTDADGTTGSNPAVGSQSTSGSLLLHNNLNTVSAKWSQGWGTAEGKYGVINCTTCHLKNTSNNKLVAGVFNASTGTWDSTGTSSLTVIYNNTTPLGTDDVHSTSTKACEVCHTKTNHHKYNNVAANHEGTVDCLTCHSHKEAFMPTCSVCHSTAQGDRRQVLGSGGDFFTNMSTHGRFTSSSSQACAVCHYGPTHQTLGDGVSVNLKHADTGASVLYDGTTATASAVKNVCISCHDADGASLLGTNSRTPFAVTGDKNMPLNIGQYWAATGGAHDVKMVCMNCHGNSKGVDGSTLNPKYNAHASGSKSILQDAGYNVINPNTYCANCHNASSTDPNKSSMDIAGEMAKAYKHTTAKCFDCHGDENNAVSSVHQLVAGSQTAGSGVIAKNISKATGTNPTWSSTPWGGAIAMSNLPSGTATAEYQVCFKCHGAVGVSTTPPMGNGTTGSGSLTNLALEFNPNNASRHPVGTALRASDRLAVGELTGGWAPGSVMTCSDCHATDTAASKGPHGSSVKWMLTGTNKAWPYTTTAGNGASSGTLYMISNATGNGTNTNGLFCRNCHPVVGTNNWHANGDITGGEHGGNAITACASCHIRVPHGGKISRLLQTTGAPARFTSNGSGATSNFDFWGTSSTNIKGSSFSSSNFNSQCGQHNNGGVGGEHW